MDKVFELPCLLETADVALDIQRNAHVVKAGLKMCVEQVKFVSANLAEVDLSVQTTFHCNGVITHRRKFESQKIFVRYRKPGNRQQTSITAVS